MRTRGRPLAVVVAIVAGLACGSGGDAVVEPQPPFVAVVFAPHTATVVVGGTVRLIAKPRDAAGDGLTGRAVAWVNEQPAAPPPRRQKVIPPRERPNPVCKTD